MTTGVSASQILLDAVERVRDVAQAAVRGLTVEQLTARLDPDANTVAWLVWHLARVQDDHVAEVAGTEQVWTADGWHDRFGLPFDRTTIGYGQSSDEVAHVVVSADLLAGYLDAVVAATVRYVEGLSDADLARVVDDRWDPPVTLAVRLVSVFSDDLQHAGQAAFIRGVLERRR